MNKLRGAFIPYLSDELDNIRFKLRGMFNTGNSLQSYPSALMIEPANACNLHCPTCPTGSGKMNRPGRMMSLAEFKGVIDQARGYTKKITLWNFGEPFLNKDLLNMVKYATSAGMYVETSTNGHFFRSGEFCQDIVKSGLQHLIICLDGADQETISKLRKNAKFSEIVDGFTFINRAKEKLNSKLPLIELQFIVMKHNEHQRSYMKQLAKELKVDTYCEKPVGIDCRYPEFHDLAKELLPSDLSLSRFYLKPDGTYALKGKVVNSCSKIYLSAVINSDGTVVPCSYDVYSEYIMGNVYEESLKSIWKNSRYQAFRKQIREDRKSIPMCNTCSEGRYAVKTRVA